MFHPNVYILSGPVHSGKTSRLASWVKSRPGIGGILAPVIDGKRHLLRVDTNEIKRVELIDSEVGHQPEWRIGNYVFSEEVFLWGQQVLKESCSVDLQWMIIDEIGFLELGGKGLEPTITNILTKQTPASPEKILLVVRDKLRLKVIRHYQLDSIQEFNFF